MKFAVLFIGEVALAQPPAVITVDYPAEGSVFPPEFPAPTFLWRDPDKTAIAWVIEAPPAGVRAVSRGERMPIGRIDPRTVAKTNRPPERAAAHSWKPDLNTWAAIQKASPVAITITGYRDAAATQTVSRGQVTILTSPDPVGAPIFYRDVPLMPSELEKGVIKPLAAAAVPLIAWRLRNVGETESRVKMFSVKNEFVADFFQMGDLVTAVAGRHESSGASGRPWPAEFAAPPPSRAPTRRGGLFYCLNRSLGVDFERPANRPAR